MDSESTNSIVDTNQRAAANFSFLTTFSNLAVNNEFKNGYVQLQNGKHNTSTYIYEALSAVASKVGSVMYDNVTNYIDCIADIDTCKVIALKSMLKELGFDYSLFDDVQFLPLEIRNLIDLLSIDKRYLADNSYVKADMIDALSGYSYFRNADGIDSYDNPAIYQHSAPDSYHVLSDAGISGNCIIFNEDNYDKYVQNVFYSVLLDFLNLEYNEPFSVISNYTSEVSSNLVKDNLADIDNYFVYDRIPMQLDNDISAIQRLKTLHNIVDFDQTAIVDKIDEGKDSLDNYAGPRLEILEAEISRRAKTLTIVKDNNDEDDPAYQSTNLSTRYSYYRKAKVLEYAKFIDNKFCTDVVSAERYKLDPNYLLVQQPTEYQNVISANRSENGTRQINYSMVAYVAKSLANITKYIAKMRQQLKLQTRKNYMKGTSNALRLVIFQYLYDYAMTYNKLSLSGEADLAVHRLLNAILSKSNDSFQLNDIEVQEYFDNTEYFNLSTDTTPFAYNKHYANNRFFDDMFEYSHGSIVLKKDPVFFTEAQLSAFYADVMLMNDIDQKNQLLGIYEFLSAIYNVGANSTYVRPDDMKVMSQLANGIFTKDMIDQLNVLSSAYNKFNWYLFNENALSDYTYPVDTIKNQKTDAKLFISAWVTGCEMSALSVTYDKYYPIAMQLSNDVAKLSSDYDNFLKSEYASYFEKADYEYCYEQSGDKGSKVYKHDYFVGNPVWSVGQYMQDELQNLALYSSISSNIRNHVAYDAIDALLNGYGSKMIGYYAVKAQVESLIGSIQQYGYLPLGAEDLTLELDNINSFLQQKISTKLQFLNDSLQQFKQQTSDLQSQYQQLETSFAACASRCPGIDQGYYFEYVGKEEDEDGNIRAAGSYRKSSIGKSVKVDDERFFAEYDKNSGEYFIYAINKDGKPADDAYFERHACNIDITSGTLGSRMQELKATLNGNAYYGSNYTGAANVKEAVSTLQKAYSDLVIAVDCIIQQVKDIFDVDIQKTSNDVDLAIISNIFEVLSKISDSDFQSNAQIITYNKAKADIIKVVSDFDVTKSSYETFKKDENQLKYFTNFTFLDALTPTAMSLISAYVVDKDSKSQAAILQQTASLNDQMTQILQDFTAKTSDLMLYYQGGILDKYVYDVNLHFEDILHDLTVKLLLDISNRKADAYYKVQLSCDDINKIYIDFNCALSDYHSSPDENGPLSDVTTTSISTLVEAKLSAIDFYNNQSYINNELLLKTYGGLSDSYDPYYNHKNKTHPSFQLHPFMYNFVEKPASRVQDISYQFANLFDPDLDRKGISAVIDKYIGKCGEAIQLWKNNHVDYSGYVTNYEISKHVDSYTGEYSEVVDYDGMFYPPALDDLVNHRDEFLNSLSSQVTTVDVAKTIAVKLDKDKLFADPSTYMHDKLGSIIEANYIGKRAIVDKLAKEFKIAFNGKKAADLTENQIVNFVIRNISERTCFEKYYGHLGLTQLDCQHIADQLIGYYEKIKEFYAAKTAQNEVQDIWKYAKDANDNIFILCKQYSQDNPTYLQKRDTRGELWLRKRNHPIAIPAITPIDNINGDKWSLTNVAHNIDSIKDNKTVSTYVFEQTNNEQLNGKCFYDFEMSRDGKHMLLVHDYDGKATSTGDISRALVSFTYVVQKTSDLDKRQYVIFNELMASRTEHEKHVAIPVEYSEAFDFICTGTTGSKISRIIYLQHNDGTSDYLVMYTAKTDNGTFDVDYVVLDSNYIDDNLIACSFYKSNSVSYMDVCIANPIFDDDRSAMKNSYGNAKVDIDANTEDNNYFDIEYTSHDILADQLNIKKYALLESGFNKMLESSNEYNLNADMSYVPSYPGLDGELTLSNDMKFNQFANVELLGTSKSIDDCLSCIDISSSQQVDADKYTLYKLSTLILNGIYGRAYEDFPGEAYTDNTIRFEHNPLLDRSLSSSRKTPTRENYTYADYQNDADSARYIWSIPLDTSNNDVKNRKYSYTPRQLRDLTIALCKKSTRNQNFYYIGKLANIIDAKVSYDKDANSIAEEVVVSSGNEVVLVAGSTDSILKDNENLYSLNNHLDNIKDIKFRYYTQKNQQYLAVVFEFEDPSKIFAIDEGEIQLVMFSKYDLDQFYYSHYLDQQGIIRADKITYVDNLADVFDDSGWALVYNKKTIRTKNLKNEIKSYYDKWSKDESSTRELLKNVKLSRYNYLSDVYILNIDKARVLLGENDSNTRILSTLSFKQDEDISYSNLSTYYNLHELDTDFPFTAGQLYSAEVADSVERRNNIFNNKNTFVISTEDNSIVNNIGKVTIPTSIDLTEDLRVYEDYFTDFNNKMYKSTSPEFYHFTHIVAEGSTNLKELSTYDLSRAGSIAAVEQALISCNVPIRKSESNSLLDAGMSYIIDDFSEQHKDVDLAKMLKLVVNYERTSAGIKLFFNYNNYFNSQYETTDINNKIRNYVVDGTYLSLEQDQTGFLDICLQFKYFNNGVLYGCRTAKALTYEITNVSDDKPKFIMRQIFKLTEQDKDTAFIDDKPENIAKLVISNIDVFSSAKDIDEQPIEVNLEARLLVSNGLKFDKIEADLLYPNILFKQKAGENKYVGTPGYVHMEFMPNNMQQTCTLYIDQATIQKYVNKSYMLSFDDIQVEATDYIDVQSNIAYVRIMRESYFVLAGYDTYGPTISGNYEIIIEPAPAEKSQLSANAIVIETT